MSKKRTVPERLRECADYIMLGQELAMAEQAEKRRLAQGLPPKSPMPKENYCFESPALSLLKPVPHPLDAKLASLC